MDIVVPLNGTGGRGVSSNEQQTGFLATTVDEYADAIAKMLSMDDATRARMVRAALQHSAIFSTRNFEDKFIAAMLPVLPAASERVAP